MRCRKAAKQWLLTLPLGAALFAGAVGFSFNAYSTHELLEERNREANNLLDIFVPPLSEAVQQGDDLNRIDQLRRLKRVPIVTGVEVTQRRLSGNAICAPLLQTPDRSQLCIQLSPRSLKKWNFFATQRLLAAVCFGGAMGALLGWILSQQWRQAHQRLQRTFRDIKRRRRQHVLQLLSEQAALRKEWLRQAIALYSTSLVMLDDKQRLITFNSPAAARFHLTPEDVGRHWLDVGSVEWAAALQTSLRYPNKPVPCTGQGLSAASIVSFQSESNGISSTWIEGA